MSYPSYDICFTVEGFSEDQDFDNIYLGIDRVLPIKTDVKLTAMFDTSDAYAAFMNWWTYNVQRGVSIFVVQLKVFGTVAYYGIEQQTALSSRIINGTTHEVTFTAKVVIDATNAINNIPDATPISVSMETNEQNIYIQLGGVDLDNDPLTYEIVTQPTNGTLSGTPPLMVYTPFTDFIGTDTFTYTVSDFFSDSQPATVTLNVGSLVVPTFIVEYVLSAPIRVTGNFFYDIGDNVWRRGVGGYITPLTNTIRIASNDHRLDERDNVVTSIRIISFGDRTDFRYFLKNKTNVLTLYVELTAGQCKGIDFYEALYNTRIASLPVLYFPYAEILTGFLELATTQIVAFSGLPLGIYFDRIFKDSGAKRVIGLGTTSGKYFQEMFSGATQLVCVSSLDTRQKLNTANMFYNTPALLNPDSSARILLENGALHSYSGCGVKIDSISNPSSTACHVATIGGTCTSTATYTATVSNNVGAVTYNWIASGPVTIIGGGSTATVTVNVTGSGGTLTCTATDTVSNSQASVSPIHNVVYDYLELYLPQSSSQINLETYINANNPFNKTEVLIYNNVSNGSIASGNLTGKNVELVLNANIHGFQKTRTNANNANNHGLYLTSQLKLTNNAIIAAAGGYGGAGGKGADDTYQVTTDTHHWLIPTSGWCTPQTGIFWMSDAAAAGNPWATQISWSGQYRQVSNDPNITSYNWDGTMLYRGSYKGAYGCQGAAPTYDVITKSTTTTPRIGGAGGLGGAGIGYNTDAAAGAAGSPSTPAGGYSGGAGGAGGTWGTVGTTGANGAGGGAAGSIGYSPANAIQGASFLKSGSVTGTCYGSIV